MNSASSSGDSFDVRKLRKLLDLMQEHDLSEIDLRDGSQRVRLRKGPLVAESRPVAAAPVAKSPASAPAESSAAPADAAHMAVITSPMVGTFYTAASPDAPPFVKVGDHVGPDTTVCIIEAMKVFNEIPSEKAGQIVAVLVENGAAVEFGQPLFKVDTRQ